MPIGGRERDEQLDTCPDHVLVVRDEPSDLNVVVFGVDIEVPLDRMRLTPPLGDPRERANPAAVSVRCATGAVSSKGLRDARPYATAAERVSERRAPATCSSPQARLPGERRLGRPGDPTAYVLPRLLNRVPRSSFRPEPRDAVNSVDAPAGRFERPSSFVQPGSRSAWSRLIRAASGSTRRCARRSPASEVLDRARAARLCRARRARRDRRAAR